jgi:YHS domain-containing protein
MYFKDLKCKKCGKEFALTYTIDYVYKMKLNNKLEYFCSWRCFDRFKKDNEKIKKNFEIYC